MLVGPPKLSLQGAPVHCSYATDKVIKSVQIQFLNIAWILPRCRTKLQRQNKMNKKFRGSHCRVSVNKPLYLLMENRKVIPVWSLETETVQKKSMRGVRTNEKSLRNEWGWAKIHNSIRRQNVVGKSSQDVTYGATQFGANDLT